MMIDRSGYDWLVNSLADNYLFVLEAHPDFPSIDKMHAYCRGEWVPHDEDCFGTQSEVLREASEVAAACGLSGGLSNYGVELSLC